ncbi:MAG: type II secretion system protein [Campylobacter sp.]|nr:type II secretion system protein [Campylobacter sp.]
MKAFTMIELIFVIVILGILAAVAMPRLLATRDDAEVSKAASNIRLAVQDIGGYYVSQGKFNSNISSMTNVSNPIKVKGETCAEFVYRDINETSLNIYLNNDLCNRVWQIGSLKNLANMPFTDGIIFVETTN